MFGRILQWRHLILKFSVLGVFRLLIQSLYLLLVCSAFLFLPDTVLVGCVFLEMHPFLLGYIICWNTIVLWFRHLSIADCRGLKSLTISVLSISLLRSVINYLIYSSAWVLEVCILTTATSSWGIDPVIII